MMRSNGRNVGRWLGATLVCAAVATGCKETKTERLNVPPQGGVGRPHKLAEPFVYMRDNAMLDEMVMSNVHFVNELPELNSLGAARLKRYASIMQTYGGTIKYDGDDKDTNLRMARLETIRDFLMYEGLAEDRFDVQEGLAGGFGINGHEAREIRLGSRYQPGVHGATSGAGSAGMSGQAGGK